MIENVNFYLGKLYSNGIPAAAHLSEKKWVWIGQLFDAYYKVPNNSYWSL